MFTIKISIPLTLIFLSLGLVACMTPGPQAGSGAQDGTLYDSDRDVELDDNDGDGIPDLTERIAGTDPEDSADIPRSRIEKAVEELLSQKTPRTPTQGVCLSNYVQYGPLCIWGNSQTYNWRYDDASNLCRILGGYYQFANPRVATYEDLFHIYFWYSSDAFRYNPMDKWIGNMVGDNRVLCGNRSVSYSSDPDRYDFEGNCNKNEQRSFWCAYDAY